MRWKCQSTWAIRIVKCQMESVKFFLSFAAMEKHRKSKAEQCGFLPYPLSRNIISFVSSCNGLEGRAPIGRPSVLITRRSQVQILRLCGLSALNCQMEL